MCVKLLIVTGLVMAGFSLVLTGCKKADQKSKIDPHSAEAVLRQVVDQCAGLREGVKTKDFAYVTDRAYVLQGLAKALFAKLDAEQKQQVGGLFNDVTRVAEELDHAAGRRHEGAMVASFEKLEGLLKELEGKLGKAKK